MQWPQKLEELRTRLILKLFNDQLLQTVLPNTESFSEDEMSGACSKNRRRKKLSAIFGRKKRVTIQVDMIWV